MIKRVLMLSDPYTFFVIFMEEAQSNQSMLQKDSSKSCL